MHLHELTEADTEANNQLRLAITNLMNHYKQKVAPIKKEIDEMYAEQYLPAVLNRYKQSVKPIVNTVQYLNNAVEQQRKLLTPAMLKSFTNTKANLFKQMRIRPQSIHDRNAIASQGVQYTRGNGPLGDANKILDIAEEFNRFLKDKFALSKKVSGKPIATPWPNPVTPGVDQPSSDSPGPRPDPKGADIPKKGRKTPAVVDPGLTGDVLSPEQPDIAGEIGKGSRQVIDGEWTVIDQAMKRLPKQQLRLTDQRPKAGDYVMWTGGARSSRSGQANYGKVDSVRDNGVLNVTSINQQPNSSRQGRPFGLNPKSVEKTMSQQQLSKILPQPKPSGAIKQGIASNSSGYKYTPKA